MANPAIGGNGTIFDQSFMFVTSHVIFALNHREMLFLLVAFTHFLEIGAFDVILKSRILAETQGC